MPPCGTIVNGQRCDGAGGGGGVLASQALQISGLTNPPTGTVDTAIVRFANPAQNRGTVPLADWVTVADDAATGTIFTVTSPGIYYARWLPVMINAANWITGVSLAATLAQLVATNPPDGTLVQYQGRVDFAQPTGVRTTAVDGPIQVTQADIDAGDNVIRVHATDNAAAPIAGVFNLAACSFLLRLIARSE